MSVDDELSQVRRHRQEKLRALRDRGVETYAYSYERTHLARDAITRFEQDEASEGLTEEGHGAEVSVAGRIMSYRTHGKSAFAHVEDRSSQIQIYLRKNILGDENFEDLDLYLSRVAAVADTLEETYASKDVF